MYLMNKKLTNYIFNGLIILFFATPFLFMLYWQAQQYMIGINIKEILEMNPYLNVIFITSFITPFIGFYMLYLKQELEKNLSKEVFILHLFIIVISFLIMGNYTYGLFIFILIYFIGMEWKIEINKVYYRLKEVKFSFKNWLAPIILLVTAILIRLMFMFVSNS